MQLRPIINYGKKQPWVKAIKSKARRPPIAFLQNLTVVTASLALSSKICISSIWNRTAFVVWVSGNSLHFQNGENVVIWKIRLNVQFVILCIGCLIYLILTKTKTYASKRWKSILSNQEYRQKDTDKKYWMYWDG